MQKFLLSSVICLILGMYLNAQSDTMGELPSIQISAYSAKSDIIRLPANLQLLKDTLHIDHNFSLANTFNIAPGVRLEERSPGSYRLSIRGSTLRSPFGVRNVKVYLDGFTLSDGGGNTYLQLLAPALITRAEVLKGPASSLYGAGTGGTVLLNTDHASNEISAGYSTYHRWEGYGNYHQSFGKWNLHAFKSIQQGDGFRDQSSMKRDLNFFSANFTGEKSNVKLLQLYGDLHYDTPGGLTMEQQTANPHQARPAAGKIPGAVEQMAGIYNKTYLSGLAYQYRFNDHWSVDPSIQHWYTDFRNPFITNYEIRYENNFSFRPTVKYYAQTHQGDLELLAGIEYIQQNTLDKNFGNKKGIPTDTIQSIVNLKGKQSNTFLQFKYNYKRWQLLTGLSLNKQVYDFKNQTDIRYTLKESGPVWMPRFSLSYKWNSHQSIFFSAARGNSPPSLAEIRPSSSSFNKELLPESGWNYEVGFKSFGPYLDYTINLYSQKLSDAIVRRNDAAGVEYFINSGGADMKGIESWWSLHFNKISIHFSNAYQPYTFQNYKQRTTDYSGLHVTGVPQYTMTGGIVYSPFSKVKIGLSSYYQSRLPLNDANTIWLAKYQVWNAFTHYAMTPHFYLKLSVENISDVLTNPGPDINAAANRYFNPGFGRTVAVHASYKW